MKIGVAITCALIVYGFGQPGFAQAPPRRFSVVVSPALLVPVTVAAQAGLQCRLSKRSALLLEAAVPTFQPDNTEYESTRSLRTGFEFKYFFKEKAGAANYFSIQSNYLFRELINRNGGNYFTRTETFAYGDAHISSPVLSMAIKRGVEIAAGKRLYVDAFGGIGLRMIFTEYDAKTALVTSSEPPRPKVYDYDGAWRYNYTLTRLHATAGVRLGFRL